MNRRLVLKTVFICSGTFIILLTGLIYYFLHNYRLDTEKRVMAAVASTGIEEGTIINENMIVMKEIKASDYNAYMLENQKEVLGKKAQFKISEGDYFRNYVLLDRTNWYKDSDRVIVLPMDTEDRLANLIKKGSLVDIKVLYKDVGIAPEVVLSRVFVDDILDESGVSSDAPVTGKKVYAKLVLDEDQRNRIYIASKCGKLTYELYCDPTQKPAEEKFLLPTGVDKVQTSSTVNNAEKGRSIPEDKLP